MVAFQQSSRALRKQLPFIAHICQCILFVGQQLSKQDRQGEHAGLGVHVRNAGMEEGAHRGQTPYVCHANAARQQLWLLRLDIA